jgi:surface antigen
MPRVVGYRIAAIALVVLGFGATAGVSASADDPTPTTPVGLETTVSAAVANEPAVVAVPARASKPAPVLRRAAVPAARPAPRAVAVPRPIDVERRIGVDGYPWSRATTNAHDTWGFTQRQCVSYVAWRLSAAGRPVSNEGNRWGSALHWDEAAGRSSTDPAVGAVAHWNAGETSKAFAGGRAGRFTAGGYGHVGYVTAVYPDGSVEVAQYNLRGDRRFSSMRMTAPRYLHLS